MTEPTRPARKRSRRWSLLLILSGLGIAVTLATMLYLSGDETTGGAAAVTMCENLVRDRLKSPSTAAFTDADIKGTAGNMWIVRGSVDSQNTFGAIIRSDYVCEISDERPLRLIDLQLTER
jgi:hypothetical protein